MDNQKLILIIVSCLLVVAITYIATEKINFCESAQNESNFTGYNSGFEKGFNQGYFNGSRDYLIILNQQKVFPCLNFQTGEYNEKSIGGLCENE